MTAESFAPGHLFFRAGDAGDRAYVLHEGQVELLAGEGDGARIALFSPGDVFGETALIEERPRFVTARAVTAGRADALTREEFERLLTSDPARTREFLTALFERLRQLSARLGVEAEIARARPQRFAPAKPERSPGPVDLPFATGESSGWVVVIYPLTRKAAETLPDEGLRVTRFPLRIGRVIVAGEKEAFDLNDLWLLDDKPFNVSRNHCEIHVDDAGPMVRDRGSHLGCVVNDEWIGGRAVMGYARLGLGDNAVIIGSRTSPYQFRVNVSRA